MDALDKLEQAWDDDTANALAEWLNVGTVKRTDAGEFVVNPKMDATDGDTGWDTLTEDDADNFFEWCRTRG